MNALFLRDFDAEQALVADTVTEPEDQGPPLFTFTEAEITKMLADARAEGQTAGLTEGESAGRQAERATIEAEALGALQALQAQLAEFNTQDASRRDDMQRDIVDLFLDIAERVAPDFLAAHSAELVQARLSEAVNLAREHSRLNITLSPETQSLMAETFKVLDPTEDLLIINGDPDFKPGEARVTWDNGFLKYNIDRVVGELLDGLREASAKLNPQPQKV